MNYVQIHYIESRFQLRGLQRRIGSEGFVDCHKRLVDVLADLHGQTALSEDESRQWVPATVRLDAFLFFGHQ